LPDEVAPPVESERAALGQLKAKKDEKNADDGAGVESDRENVIVLRLEGGGRQPPTCETTGARVRCSRSQTHLGPQTEISASADIFCKVGGRRRQSLSYCTGSTR
jgi:hypothetical protein